MIKCVLTYQVYSERMLTELIFHLKLNYKLTIYIISDGMFSFPHRGVGRALCPELCAGRLERFSMHT